MSSLPSPKTAAKIVLVWIVGNVVWTLLSAAAGAIASSLLKGAGVLANPYSLVGVALLVAAGVASLAAAAQRRRRETPRTRVASASTKRSFPRLPMAYEQSAQSTGMTTARRRAAIKQYEQTRKREAEQREKIKRELRDEEAASLDTDALWLSEQLHAGNTLLARWQVGKPSYNAREEIQGAADWEHEVHGGLAARLPADSGWFGLEVGLGREFIFSPIEVPERTRLRRRLHRLGEIADRHGREQSK